MTEYIVLQRIFIDSGVATRRFYRPAWWDLRGAKKLALLGGVTWV